MRSCKTQTLILFSLGLCCSTVPTFAKERFNVYGDFLYMQRSEDHNTAIVKDSHKHQNPCKCPDHTVIDTDDLVHDFEFEPGYRVGFTITPGSRNSIEGNYFHLQPWSGDKKVYGHHGHNSLSFPFTKSGYSNDFTHARAAKAEYWSHLWGAELNYWRNFTPRRVNYFALAGIAGLRYFHWDESFKLSMTKPPDKSTYSIHTKNRIYGAQIGLDFQMNPMHWLSWEFFGKVGLAGNDTDQRQYLGDRDDRVTLRHSDSDEWEMLFFSDVAAQLGFHFLRYFTVRVGYQMMFFSGLSLATDQISKKVGSHAGKKDDTHGNAIVHGVFGGLVFGF